MSLIERVATALYDHCHEAEHGEVYENETEAGREYWNSFARAAIAAMPQLEAMQSEIEKLREALSWAEGHDPWLVEKIRERAALGQGEE